MSRDFPILRELTEAAPEQVIAGAPRPPGLDQTIEHSGRGATAI
jgi:hypothetical protein